MGSEIPEAQESVLLGKKLKGILLGKESEQKVHSSDAHVAPRLVEKRELGLRG